MADGQGREDGQTWVVLFEAMVDLTPPWRDKQWLTVVVRADDRDRAVQTAEAVLGRRYDGRLSAVDLRDARMLPADGRDGVVVRGRACGIDPDPADRP